MAEKNEMNTPQVSASSGSGEVTRNARDIKIVVNSANSADRYTLDFHAATKNAAAFVTAQHETLEHSFMVWSVTEKITGQDVVGQVQARMQDIAALGKTLSENSVGAAVDMTTDLLKDEKLHSHNKRATEPKATGKKTGSAIGN